MRKKNFHTFVERGQGRRLPHFPYKILPRQKKSRNFSPLQAIGGYVFASRNTYRCFLSAGNEPIWSDKLHQPTVLLSPIFLLILSISFLLSLPPCWQGEEWERERTTTSESKENWGHDPKAMSVSGDTRGLAKLRIRFASFSWIMKNRQKLQESHQPTCPPPRFVCHYLFTVLGVCISYIHFLLIIFRITLNTEEGMACAFLQLVCSHNRRCLFHLGPDDH